MELGPVERPVIWIFLAFGRFDTRTPEYERLILLDFLGFSRPNHYFSMGYTDFSLKEISRAFPP
jgi:hypothetical protein